MGLTATRPKADVGGVLPDIKSWSELAAASLLLVEEVVVPLMEEARLKVATLEDA